MPKTVARGRSSAPGQARGRNRSAVARERRALVLDAVRGFQAEHGRVPHLGEVMARLGWGPTRRASVNNDLGALREAGLIARIPARAPAGDRSMQQVPRGYGRRAIRSLRWTEEDERIYRSIRQTWAPWLHWFAASSSLRGPSSDDEDDEPEGGR
ncbi:hypothetical protein AB1L88_15820 [Tautonia sp. JC769]|uniref:hypothetical protein n=1 Tax=Tautonia sp. JC769 TaxID=3232135 RepID=UPI003457E937